MGVTFDRVSDLCQLITTGVNPRDRPGVLCLGLEHLQTGRIYRIGAGTAADAESGKSTFQAGDILYGKLRPYLDKAVIADQDGICTTELLVLRPNKNVDPFFLVAVLHSWQFIEHAMSGVTGVQHPRTSWRCISDFKLPRLSTEEQIAVGEIVKTIDMSLTACETSIDSISNLKAMVMRAVFTRGLRGEAQKETDGCRLPGSWDAARLGTLAKIGNGSTPNRKEPSFWGGAIPYITSSKLYGTRVTGAVEFVTRDAVAAYSLPLLAPGTILIAIVGQGKTLGHAAILDIEATVSRHVGYLSLRDCNIVKPAFLRYFLELSYSRLRILASGNGSTRSALTAGLLREVVIPVPKADEQVEIISILESLDAVIAIRRDKRKLLEAVFGASLRDLIDGRLLPRLSTILSQNSTEVANAR